MTLETPCVSQNLIGLTGAIYNGITENVFIYYIIVRKPNLAFLIGKCPVVFPGPIITPVHTCTTL